MENLMIATFSNHKLQELISSFEEKYDFTKEEDICLKSLLITILLITRSEESVYNSFPMIIEEVQKNRAEIHYDKILFQWIDNLFLKNENDVALMNQIIHNFVVDGYLFHSFNAAFFDSIQSLGLSTEGRQWEAEEINEIRTIFSKHGFTGIFGLYRESKENPIFLANSLKSSVFYAYSSPTWFRHFVSGGMKGERNEYNKDAFFRRDYQSAKNNVLKLAHQAELDVLEQQKVLAFFEKYWGKIASKEFPYIALIKRSVIQSKTLLLEPLPGETAHSFTKRYIRIYQDKNEIVKSNIPVEQLFLFPYDFSKIKELQIKDYPKNLK